MGTYIGHCYSAFPQPAIDFSKSPPLHQSWLNTPQPGILPTLVPSNSRLVDIIPWLLYYHDARHTRNHELAQHLTSAQCTTAITTMTAALYILGDCLEWLMQAAPVNQAAHPSLCRHLQQQSLTYPAAIRPPTNRLIVSLEPQSLSTDDYQTQDSNDLMMALAAAIQQSLTYPENLALALNTSDRRASTSTLIGCLLGAWRGTSVIPSGWIMSLPNTSRQTLTLTAKQLYRSWAGINHISATFEVFSLDL